MQRDAERLATQVSEDTFRSPSVEGAWSPSQLLDHLSIAARTYATSMEAALISAPDSPTAGTVTIHPGVASRWFIRSLEPPVRLKLPAPGKIVPPPSRARDDVLREFREAHERVRELARRCDRVDVNRVRFANPFVPLIRFTIGTGLAIIVAHDRRHVVQMARGIQER